MLNLESQCATGACGTEEAAGTTPARTRSRRWGPASLWQHVNDSKRNRQVMFLPDRGYGGDRADIEIFGIWSDGLRQGSFLGLSEHKDPMLMDVVFVLVLASIRACIKRCITSFGTPLLGCACTAKGYKVVRAVGIIALRTSFKV